MFDLDHLPRPPLLFVAAEWPPFFANLPEAARRGHDVAEAMILDPAVDRFVLHARV
jgi:hypothetical protein